MQFFYCADYEPYLLFRVLLAKFSNIIDNSQIENTINKIKINSLPFYKNEIIEIFSFFDPENTLLETK